MKSEGTGTRSGDQHDPSFHDFFRSCLVTQSPTQTLPCFLVESLSEQNHIYRVIKTLLIALKEAVHVVFPHFHPRNQEPRSGSPPPSFSPTPPRTTPPDQRPNHQVDDTR